MNHGTLVQHIGAVGEIESHLHVLLASSTVVPFAFIVRNMSSAMTAWR
jgi:hypothetical protein